MSRYFDVWSLAVIAATFVLFLLALLSKGLTHDIFLEAGVLLISAKLVMNGHKSMKAHQASHELLKSICDRLESVHPSGGC